MLSLSLVTLFYSFLPFLHIVHLYEVYRKSFSVTHVEMGFHAAPVREEETCMWGFKVSMGSFPSFRLVGYLPWS